MPDSNSSLVVSGQQLDRAEEVRLHIMQLKGQITSSFLALARLLKEARDNDYALAWGYARFGVWVETASGLDLSERSAYYLIRIVERADELEIPDSELESVKISSLKEIFSLPADTDPQQIRELVTEAKSMSHNDVRQVVGTMKNEDWVYHSLKILREVEDNVYQPALERIRREFGNTLGPDGNPEDISDSRCIEFALAAYLASPEEHDGYTIIDAEFHDITASEEAQPSEDTT